MQLPQSLHRFRLDGDADSILHARYKRQKKRSRPKDKKPKRQKKRPKKEKWGDDRRTRFGEIIGRQNPPFFGLSSPTDPFSFPLIFPPDQIGTSSQIVWFSGFFWISRFLGASVPFSLFSTIASHLNPCVSPDFRVSTLFFPLVSLSWRRFTVCFLSLYSQLGFTLCGPLVILPYFLPSTLPTLLVTVETTHVCLSTWLPSS